MNTKQSTSTQPASAGTAASTPPPPSSGTRDNSGLYYSTHIKITDPQSGQVLLHTRGE